MLCALLYQQLFFTYFGFFGNHYNSSVCSVMSRLQNVKSQYQSVYWKLLTAELLELGAISSSAEISGFLEFQLRVEGIVFLKLP